MPFNKLRGQSAVLENASHFKVSLELLVLLAHWLIFSAVFAEPPRCSGLFQDKRTTLAQRKETAFKSLMMLFTMISSNFDILA